MDGGVVENKLNFNGELDIEWLQLIMEAKSIGIQLDDVKKFFLNNKEKLAEG